jgi:hypothetical protein
VDGSGPILNRRISTLASSVVVPVPNVTSTYDPTSDTYTAVLRVPAAPGTAETYADVAVLNPGSGRSSTSSSALYYTDSTCTPNTEFLDDGGCAPCPTGAVCPGGNRVWPQSGYWNPGEDSGYVLKCSPESRCLGGAGSPCTVGHSGDLCSECAPQFVRATSGACVPCPSIASRLIYMVGDIVVWLLVAMMAWFSRSSENLQRVVDVVIVLQSASGFASLMTPKFPNWIVAIYDVLFIFMGNWDVFKASCYGDDVELFGARFVSQLVYTVAIGAVLVIGVPVVGLVRRAMVSGGDTERRKFIGKYTYDRTVRCFSTWCQIAFMNLTRRALETVYCVSLGDGTLRVAAFPSVKCFAGFHIIAFAISCVILLSMTIGWPLLYSLLVVRGRSTEELYGEPRIMHRWGNGYMLFKPSHRYFYMVFYFSATCVSAAYVFFAGNAIARLCLAGGAIVVEVAIIFRSSPHARGRDDYVQLSYDIPMAMLVAVTSAVEMGSLSDQTIYILSLVALGMITICFLFHAGDLALYLIRGEADTYELGVADHFLEDDAAGAMADLDNKDQDASAVPAQLLPNMAALRQRRRSVFEDVGVALGLMDDADEADEFVTASDVAVGIDTAAVDASDRGLLQIIAETLGFDDSASAAPPPAVMFGTAPATASATDDDGGLGPAPFPRSRSMPGMAPAALDG